MFSVNTLLIPPEETVLSRKCPFSHSDGTATNPPRCWTDRNLKWKMSRYSVSGTERTAANADRDKVKSSEWGVRSCQSLAPMAPPLSLRRQTMKIEGGCGGVVGFTSREKSDTRATKPTDPIQYPSPPETQRGIRMEGMTWMCVCVYCVCGWVVGWGGGRLPILLGLCPLQPHTPFGSVLRSFTLLPLGQSP